MAINFQNPVTAGTTLVREAIQSPDYSPGVSGWIIKQDGSAEFNDLDIRGTFNGTDFTLNSAGAFFYNGTPAAGNLIASIAPADGTDAFGNAYVAGISVFDNINETFANLVAGSILFGDNSGATPDTADAGSIVALISAFPVVQQTLTTTSPKGGAHSDPLVRVDAGGAPGQTTGSIDAPALKLTDAVGSSAADLLISGTVIQTDLTGVADSRHVVGSGAPASPYNANWSASTVFGTLTGLAPLQYQRIGGQDSIGLGGCFTSAAGAGAAVFTLPAALHPKAAFPITLAKMTAGTLTWVGAYVSVAGNVNLNSQFGSGATAGATYAIPWQIIPLGNVP